MRIRLSMQLAFFGLHAVLALAACSRTEESIQQFDAWASLQNEAFGAGTLTLDHNNVSVAVSDAGEGGVWLRAPETSTADTIVSFEYVGAAPANVRVTKANAELVYGSTDARSYVVIEKGSSEGALVYSGPGTAFEITITGIEYCGAPGVVCRPDGVVERRIAGNNGDADIVAGTYGLATLTAPGDSSVLVKSAGSGEFGVTLAPAEPLANRSVLDFTGIGQDRSLVVTGPERKDYFSTAQGWVVLGSNDAALVYGAGPGTIELSKVRLKQCEPIDWKCASDVDLVKQSSTASVGKPDLPALLAWATREADFGFSRIVSSKVDVGNLSAAQIFARYYRDDAAGGFCGATATFFARLLRAHGYEAFTMDFGVPASNLTHVTTVVAQGEKFYIWDATFGGYFAKRGTSEPLDVISILDGAPYSLIELKAPDRTFIVDERTYKNPAGDIRISMFRDCMKNKATGFLTCHNPEFGLAQYLQAFSTALSTAGLEPGESTLVDLLRRGVSGIGDGQDTDSMRTFARELDRRGIVFHEIPGTPSPSRLLLP